MRRGYGAFALCALAAAAAALALMAPRFDATPPAVPPPAPPASEVRAAAPAPAPEPPPSSAPTVAPGALPAPSSTPAPALVCPADMIAIDGIYCPMVVHRCEAYLGAQEPKKRRDPYGPESRCERFADTRWCEGRPFRLHYCIDRFEYPNLAGARPAVMVSYREARKACLTEGKRLCLADEWALACEGERIWPYATGRVRDPGACNIDRRARAPIVEAFTRPFDVSAEVERLDQRMPSGALRDCVSLFGVNDMNGNVAEWVHDPLGKRFEQPHASALAGGHWERTPATCRALDGRRNANHRSWLVGFRCCQSTLDGVRSRVVMPPEFRLQRHRKLSL